jgi:hypothetical protein
MRDDRFQHPASNPSLARHGGRAARHAEPLEVRATQAEVFFELGVTLAAFLSIALLANLIAKLLGVA